MLPCFFAISRWLFAIDQHCHEMSRFGALVGSFEIIERCIPSTTRTQARHLSCVFQFLRQFAEALTASDLILLGLRAFNVKMSAHQRVPPISPFVHNWPGR